MHNYTLWIEGNREMVHTEIAFSNCHCSPLSGLRTGVMVSIFFSDIFEDPMSVHN
ncbi:hypothetical protein JHK87_055092 [Glycine soja]|nr:hypothetical protein JHK87_055092 [Glycine soja]